jgi:FkbM family methyltransferase
MSCELLQMLEPSRPLEVVDVGANPIDGDPPYKAMLDAGVCRVTGFEPQPEALARLRNSAGPNERYFPYVIGAAGPGTLHLCRAPGMTSLLTPDPEALAAFNLFPAFGTETGQTQVTACCLDDVTEVERVDFLKMDVQGSELAILQGGTGKLADSVAVQTEVSFVPLYRDQPVLGDIDLELRRLGFIPHCLAALKRWSIAPCVVDNDPRRPVNQLLEADLVYVRDFTRPDGISDEQLKHLALICHHCYRSVDLVVRCLVLLEQRGTLAEGTTQNYMQACAPNQT